ncbi:NPC intracellular cholesterol transporter 2 [Apis mellifera caucasica]|uniref:NPC intracellular cholesterol transporter 2 n=1 Tax=Apis mellifera TaxID=7460 RepID=A0A7M7G1N6_APIME|nr:NPC intracellular cholesterol transporter 2 [Apis mellifera]KAG6800907.1 NPC intracellular cholesterol transporter 2 [Apis mellifera caucasica]KAG9433732.1 NPC intracellular cholesterol transporter 2 [Apis mellifera carnica]|eukprot:XP_001120220.1 NPC intracellular cholesterol transporter 2 [Apis mellifera]
MAILTYVYVFAVLFIANSMQAYVPCDGKPAPTNVKILGCDTLPCNLVRGTNVEANVDFKAVANTKTLRPVVDVDLGNSHMQYPLPEQNACKNLVNGQCPLQSGQAATYYLKMPVLKAYPKVALTIQLSLVDENNNSEVCFKIPAKVVD